MVGPTPDRDQWPCPVPSVTPSTYTTVVPVTGVGPRTTGLSLLCIPYTPESKRSPDPHVGPSVDPLRRLKFHSVPSETRVVSPDPFFPFSAPPGTRRDPPECSTVLVRPFGTASRCGWDVRVPRLFRFNPQPTSPNLFRSRVVTYRPWGNMSRSESLLRGISTGVWSSRTPTLSTSGREDGEDGRGPGVVGCLQVRSDGGRGHPGGNAGLSGHTHRPGY